MSLQEGVLLAGLTGALVGFVVQLIVIGRWTGRVDSRLVAIDERMHDGREANAGEQKAILDEILRLRADRHDLIGKVARHEGAIAALQTDVTRLDARLARLEGASLAEAHVRLKTPIPEDAPH